MEYITDLRDDDVLLGRGSGPNDHEGNVRFRVLVSERKAEYMATNHRLTKAKIAQEIVDKVYANGGRFLRKLENDEIARYDVPDGLDAFAVATEETIMEKAKQALRQNTNKVRTPGLSDDDPKSKLSPRRLSPKPSHSRSPVPSSASRVPSVVGSHAAMSMPRLVDDFEPIPLEQAYATNPSPHSVMPRASRVEPDRAVNYAEPQQQQQQQQQQRMSAPSSNRRMSPHEAYLHGLTQPAPRRAPPSAPPGAEYSRSPTLPRGRPAEVEADIMGPVMMTAPPQRADTLDLQDDSILAHLPAHVRAQFLRGADALATVDDDDGAPPPSGASRVGPRNASNQSMEQIPLEDDEDNYYADSGDASNDQHHPPRSGGGGTQRLASMDMTDLARFHSRRERYQASEDNMSVVMDSFSKLKATGDADSRPRYYNRRWSNQTSESERNRMLTSTDTMGTIDPIGMGSVADMSFATMNSSTFSVYRGNEPSGPDLGPSSPHEGIPSRVIVEANPNLVLDSGPAPTPPLGSTRPKPPPTLADSAAPPSAREEPDPYRPPQPQPAAPGRFETSFSHTDLPVSRTAARYQHLLLSNPQPQLLQHDAIREDYEEAYDGVGGAHEAGAMGSPPPNRVPNRLGEDDPTGGDLGIDGMGLSSMELLKSAFHSSTDWDLSGPPTAPPTESQSVPPPYQQQQQPPPPPPPPPTG